MTDRSHEILVNAAIQCQQTAKTICDEMAALNLLRASPVPKMEIRNHLLGEVDRLLAVRDALLGVLEQEQGHGLKSTQTGGVS